METRWTEKQGTGIGRHRTPAVGTHNLTRLNGSQQGQMDHLWLGVGLTSLMQGGEKKSIFFNVSR